MPARKPSRQATRDLRIELRFIGLDAVPAFIVANVIEQLDNALYQVERDEVSELAEELANEVPVPVFNSIRYELSHFERSVRPLSITHTSHGSLVIGGLAGALAFWLLESTLGETFKEAWKQSALHERLVKLLSTRLGPKAKKFAESAREIHPPFAGSRVTSEVQTDGDVVLVVVVVDVRMQAVVVPTASDLLKK